MCEPTPESLARWVSVYLVDKAYGGPEEGGWWYDYGVLQFSIPCAGQQEAKQVCATFLSWCNKRNSQRRSDISSVLSEGAYRVYIEDHEGHNWPEERPHYE